MSFRDKSIRIDDWTGKLLYIGPYDDHEAVDKVLDANRCDCEDRDFCDKCDGSGYVGDFEVHWFDESDKEDCNVYEYINY